MNDQPIYSVTDFVAICNQVLDMSFGSAQISGELAQFKISKNRWVYFDLKDDFSSVRFFGTVYQLPGPLEDGMLLTIRGVPQLNPRFGFSITVQSIQLQGEGTIRKASQLLGEKLTREGLFNDDRKRTLPYPPSSIGLITSGESAAYADFIKIANERWVGITIQLFDVQVQGESAPEQIVRAIQYFNQHALPPDVLVIVRGGGSADDLQAFSTENVTRAVAASRIPTLVAIGHETDLSLAEKAADMRASTPSNAAQLLMPDKRSEAVHLAQKHEQAKSALIHSIKNERIALNNAVSLVHEQVWRVYTNTNTELTHQRKSLKLLDPHEVLKRGYAIVRQSGRAVMSAKTINSNNELQIQFYDGEVRAQPRKSGKL